MLNGVVSDYFDKWTGVHFLANLMIVWSLSQFFSDCISAIATFSIAVLWEVYEYFTEGFKPYGSKKDWKFDTAMDLIVSLICIGAVLI
jgi:hypothetical protein